MGACICVGVRSMRNSHHSDFVAVWVLGVHAEFLKFASHAGLGLRTQTSSRNKRAVWTNTSNEIKRWGVTRCREIRLCRRTQLGNSGDSKQITWARDVLTCVQHTASSQQDDPAHWLKAESHVWRWLSPHNDLLNHAPLFYILCAPPPLHTWELGFPHPEIPESTFLLGMLRRTWTPRHCFIPDTQGHLTVFLF